MARRSQGGEVVRREKAEVVNNAETIRQLEVLGGTIMDRLGMMARLGKSFKGRRDIYYEVGYPKEIDIPDYMARFERQDIASTIVTAFPEETWSSDPEVYENADPDKTPFEEAWGDLVDTTGLYYYLQRADILSGIGRYGVLLLGFDDGGTLQTEVKPKAGMRLLYLSPYAEGQAQVATWDKDLKSARYGLPELYNVTVGVGDGSTSGTQQVHWSRLLHMAEGCMESDVYGTPRLKKVYNRLQDIETIVAGSAEMFWKGGFQGISFEADATADFGKESKAALAEEVQRFFMGLQRYLRLQGVKANQLDSKVADPKEHVLAQVKLISAATGIPTRILLGSEEGQLAGSQDERAWQGRIQRRRRTYAIPHIMRPLVDRLQSLLVVPPTKTKVIIGWPAADLVTPKEKAEVAQMRSSAWSNYANSAAPSIISPFQYMTHELGYSDEDAKDILEQSGQALAEGALEE